MLEAVLAAHQKALEANTAALLALVNANPAIAARASQDADNAAREAMQAKRDAAKPEEKPAATPPASTGKALNYDTDIKPVALELAKKNRPALTAIWAEFKVKVGSELKPEQFEAALAAINKASA